MTALALHEFHQQLNATFAEVNGVEVVEHYGEPLAEHAALRGAVGVADLSFRSRLCLTGADRQRFLNGQVTNNVKDLRPGDGCYAALVTAKGRLESDLNIYCLSDELLLDFEPGLTSRVAARFEKFIIADDVQVIDVASHYGLLTVQGPKAAPAVERLGLSITPPATLLHSTITKAGESGDVYCVNHPRGAMAGFDLFVPAAALATLFGKLVSVAKEIGGTPCGWRALEMIRIEAGIPRFGQDMDETNLAPEAGIEARAINYSKGCYIGQEVIARIRTYGRVAKALRGLSLPDGLKELPVPGDKLLHEGREVGGFTSVLASPALQRNLALGYVRRECQEPGTQLNWPSASGNVQVTVVNLPFGG